jgi:serine/threonine protein kinase
MKPTPRIPDYELLERLGGGPLTQVFAARQQPGDRPCAVKVLRPDWEDQPTAVKLLHREARAGLSVRHPHLVRVLDAQVTHAPYFLVMERLAGESLRVRLRRTYQLAVSDAVWVGRQTAQALAALHRAGFLHGDVKPDNVQLTGDGTAVLLDLGFAHRPGENAAFLRAGYVLGTANYLAPELCAPLPTDASAGAPARGLRPNDSGPAEELSSDLFSLGVTLFEMLTGRLPYPPGSLSQTFRRHRCDPPAKLRRSAAGLQPALVALVERMLAHRPEERPKAAAVVQQLIRLEIATLGSRRAA